MKVNQKGIILTQKESLDTQLKQYQHFLRKKKITCDVLSKEMNYSTSHVVKVFNGGCPPGKKFMGELFKATENLLQKDLTDFYNLIRGTPWSYFLLD